MVNLVLVSGVVGRCRLFVIFGDCTAGSGHAASVEEQRAAV